MRAPAAVAATRGQSSARWQTLLLLAAIAAHAALLTPNMDDGVNASHIANTAAGRCFVNDVFGTPFPFQKPQTVLNALLWRIWPATFLPLALLQGAAIVACCLLFHAAARRTVPEITARTATALLATYLLTHNWLAPTRPEMALLAVGLAVLWLCQQFDERLQPAYLVAAAGLAGLVGVSTHPNAAVVIVFLLLFVGTRRRRIGRGTPWLVGTVLVAASAVGLAIVFTPDPAGTLRFLAKIKDDGQRFSFVFGELYRFSFIFRFLPYRYLSLLLLGVALARLAAGPRRKFFAEARDTLGLFGLWAVAVFTTFAVFPAARWSAYVVLHLPWFALAAAAQWHAASPPGWLRRLPLALLAAASLGTVVVNATARELDPFDFAKYGCLLLPPLIAAAAWARGRPAPLLPSLLLALAFKLVLAGGDTVAARRAATFLRQRGMPAVVNAALVWTPRAEVRPWRASSPTPSPPPRLALVAAEEEPRFRTWLAARGCTEKASGTLPDPLPSRFISPWYRGFSWHELACPALPPPATGSAAASP